MFCSSKSCDSAIVGLSSEPRSPPSTMEAFYFLYSPLSTRVCRRRLRGRGVPLANRGPGTDSLVAPRRDGVPKRGPSSPRCPRSTLPPSSPPGCGSRRIRRSSPEPPPRRIPSTWRVPREALSGQSASELPGRAHPLLRVGCWHSLGYHDLAAHRLRGEGRPQLARGGLVFRPKLRAEDSRWGRGRGQCALGLLLRQPPHPLPVGTRRRGASPGWDTLPGEL